MTLLSVIHTGFTNFQLTGIIIAFTFGFLSILLFLLGRIRQSIFFLFISGLVLRLVVANLDPFLNTWDEQFHALVAKNMMNNPLKPVLINDPVLDYDYRSWSSNHIWLHKQPWFLWQICLFFHVFGVNEYVLRLPTAIMFSLLILVIYRMGNLLIDERAGWYGAFIYAFSFFFVDYVSGILFTDHNDSAFIFYVSLSIWAFLEYRVSKKKKWIYMIGIFAGIAILNKWLAGLLVYSGWLAVLIIESGKQNRLREIRNMGISLLFTIIVALPWQLYTIIHYPEESFYVFGSYSRHLYEVVDYHGGDTWYYLTLMPEQYGKYIYFLVLPGLFFLISMISERKNKLAILTFLIVTYLFFTLTATKMPMFCDIVCTIIFLALGTLLYRGYLVVKKIIPGKIAVFLFAAILCYVALDNLYIYQVDVWHSERYDYWKKLRTAAIMDKYIAGKPHTEHCVFFNCGGFNSIMFMFYSGKTAYGGYPSKNNYNIVKNKGLKIIVFADKNLPGYLKNDNEVEKILLQCVSY